MSVRIAESFGRRYRVVCPATSRQRSSTVPDGIGPFGSVTGCLAYSSFTA